MCLTCFLFTCHRDTKRGNISFISPPSGYAADNRDKLIASCLEGVKSDISLVNLPEFTDTITIQFLVSREEMKKYTGIPASGVTLLYPRKIIYMVLNDQEKGAPIRHELMHMILLCNWGGPDQTSLWMHEGLAAFSQNECNGYNDEQIYRYFAATGMLLPMDSLVNQFYHTPEMIGYHQAAFIVQYLLKNYGVEKIRKLWQQGFDAFKDIYGTSFDRMQMDINSEAKKDYPTAPKIDWKVFSQGCN
jgi:hypothetical protein